MQDLTTESVSTTHLLVVLTRVETKLDDSLRRIDNLETRVTKLESTRWPLPTLGVLSGVGGVIVSLYSLTH